MTCDTAVEISEIVGLWFSWAPIGILGTEILPIEKLSWFGLMAGNVDLSLSGCNCCESLNDDRGAVEDEGCGGLDWLTI